MPTLFRDLIPIPEHVAKGDFVLKLTEGTDPAQLRATLESYVVTPQLAACFDQALRLVQGRSPAGGARRRISMGALVQERATS